MGAQGTVIRTDSSSGEPFFLALSTPSSSLLAPQRQHFQYGGMGRLCILRHGLGRAAASLVLQRGCLRGSAQNLRRRVWNSGGRTMHRHGIFQERHLLHELVFACSHPLSRQPQISFAILTQADCCAVQRAKADFACNPSPIAFLLQELIFAHCPYLSSSVSLGLN